MLRRVLLGILILLATGLLAAGWYAYHRGFTHKWRQFVINEFRKRGVELTMRRLTLEPFRGIVAKEVKVYETRERKRTRALIDEVRLVINYANLFQGKPFIDALDLHEATLAWPLDPSRPDKSRVVVSHLSGRLFLPPQQVYLSHLEADFYGVRISASGRLINPQAFSPGASRKNALATLGEQVVGTLKQCEFGEVPPQLEIRFSGDLASPGQLFAEATLWAPQVRRGAYQMGDFYAQIAYRDGLLKLKQLSARDRQGSLRAGAQFDPASGEITGQLHSELDLPGLSAAFWPQEDLQQTVFYTAPKLDLSVRARSGPEPAWQLLGRVDTGKFAYKGEFFESFTGNFSTDGQRWAARDVRLVHRTGEISGHLLQEPASLRSDLASTLSAKVLSRLLSGPAAQWAAQLDFMKAAQAPAPPPHHPAPRIHGGNGAEKRR